MYKLMLKTGFFTAGISAVTLALFYLDRIRILDLTPRDIHDMATQFKYQLFPFLFRIPAHFWPYCILILIVVLWRNEKKLTSFVFTLLLIYELIYWLEPFYYPESTNFANWTPATRIACNSIHVVCGISLIFKPRSRFWFLLGFFIAGYGIVDLMGYFKYLSYNYSFLFLFLVHVFLAIVFLAEVKALSEDEEGVLDA